MHQPSLAALGQHPIIAAVRDPADVRLALSTPVSVLFLLSATLLDIADTVRLVLRERRLVFVHVDLLDGLAKDAHGLRWLARMATPTGIITTRSSLIQAARHLNLATVQRVFLLDSQSLRTGIDLAREARPDLVEVLPGILPGVVQELKQRIGGPLIAGGLIKTSDQCRDALMAGALAISTSEKQLWRLTPEEVMGREATLVGSRRNGSQTS